MSISNAQFQIAAPRAPQAPPRRRLTRALLFLALSAAAVPACQYYDGDGAKQHEARAVTDGRVRT